MKTPSQILADAFGLDVDVIPDGTGVCGMCATECAVMAASRIIKPTSADLADIFRHGAWVCIPCAACFKEPRLLSSNIFASGDTGLKPMVAQSSSTSERPSWRDLVRGLEHGRETVAVFTSNTKRRLWTSAAAGIVGDVWRVLFVHGDIDRVLTLNHTELLRQLDYVESLLGIGFNKRQIGYSLIGAIKSPDLFHEVMQHERKLREIRPTDEFQIALFIAQKEE